MRVSISPKEQSTATIRWKHITIIINNNNNTYIYSPVGTVVAIVATTCNATSLFNSSVRLYSYRWIVTSRVTDVHRRGPSNAINAKRYGRCVNSLIQNRDTIWRVHKRTTRLFERTMHIDCLVNYFKIGVVNVGG